MSSGNPVRDGADATPAAALDGNLDERLEALRRRLTAAVRRVCPPWLARDTEDIAQNVLVQLSRTGLLGEEEQRLSSTYLQRAARRLVMYDFMLTEDERHWRDRAREFAKSLPGAVKEVLDQDPARVEVQGKFYVREGGGVRKLGFKNEANVDIGR